MNRTYRVPNDPLWLGLLNGVISLLFYPEFWVQAGTATVEEVTQEFQEMYVADQTPQGGSMLGMIGMFGATELPEGWVYLDGQVLARSEYPDLWDIWPSEMKDDTTLTLYDGGGRFIIGAGMIPPHGGYIVGQTGGEYEVELTVAQMPEHQHGTLASAANEPNVSSEYRMTQKHTYWDYNQSSAAGEGEAHENTPPFLALRYAIYTNA